MSINELRLEVSEVRRLQQEVETRKEALADTLGPHITAYFSNLVAITSNSEKRREYASFISSRKFEILENGDLMLSASYYGEKITFILPLAELVK